MDPSGSRVGRFRRPIATPTISESETLPNVPSREQTKAGDKGVRTSQGPHSKTPRCQGARCRSARDFYWAVGNGCRPTFHSSGTHLAQWNVVPFHSLKAKVPGSPQAHRESSSSERGRSMAIFMLAARSSSLRVIGHAGGNDGARAGSSSVSVW